MNGKKTKRQCFQCLTIDASFDWQLNQSGVKIYCFFFLAFPVIINMEPTAPTTNYLCIGHLMRVGAPNKRHCHYNSLILPLMNSLSRPFIDSIWGIWAKDNAAIINLLWLLLYQVVELSGSMPLLFRQNQNKSHIFSLFLSSRMNKMR